MKRIIFLDNISGICLLHVIFVIHCARLSGIDNEVIKGLLSFMSFCMPWFYYKSGLFYRKRNWCEELKKDARHLLLPFVIFSLLGWVPIVLLRGLMIDKVSVASILEDTFGHFLSDGAIRGNYALWFLLSLFMVKQIFLILEHILSIPSLWILLFSLLATCLYQYNSSLPVYVGNVANGLFFYALGYETSKKHKVRLWYCVPLIGILWVLLYPGYLDFRASGFWGGERSLCSWLLVEFFCLISLLAISESGKRFFNKKIRILTSIGQYSMLYYVTHYVILVISYNFCFGVLKIKDTYGLFLINTIVLILFFIILQFFFRRSKWLRISLGEYK